jgi:CBS domain-containing protein
MRVQDVMTTDVVTLDPDTPLKEAARVLLERRISGAPVVEDHRVVGVLSEADLLELERGHEDRPHGIFRSRDRRRVVADDEPRTVRDVMTSPAITVMPVWTVAGAAALMLDKDVNRLPVVRADGLAGIITRADVVRAFARTDDAIAQEVREAVMLQKALHVDESPVDVAVTGGEVVLTGTVRESDTAERLVNAARGVPGVLAVRSELRWTDGNGALLTDG